MLTSVAPEGLAYYNLRKRYGALLAGKIIGVWTHFHIDEPESAEEAIFFFVEGV